MTSIPEEMWTHITDQITRATGQKFEGNHRRSVGGGSINQAFAVSDAQQTYFVKLSDVDKVGMFEAEAIGLAEIHKTSTIRVPQPVCWGTGSGYSYLVLEWIEPGRGSNQSWEAMGQQLAAMHRVISETGFGWQQNNTIGATPQSNDWTSDWVEFFQEQRIHYQLQLAKQRGGHFPQDDLLAAIPKVLSGYQPLPSLVHGDLWSGNAAFGQSGEPVILDPATHFADREVDIAMSELFGGFPQAFYQGYNEAFPLDPGYQQRKTLYNLYHVLNHFNLFGGSYAAQAKRMIEQVLASS